MFYKMRAGSFKAFWLAFFLTAAVMIPMIAATWLWSGWENRTTDEVSQSKSGVPIAQPTAENQATILVAVTGDAPAFVLVRLDAPDAVLRFAVVPAQSVVLAANGDTVTLADSYAAAGPARVTQLLRDTLEVNIDRYLALTPETLAAALGKVGAARIALSGALTAQQLTACGLDGAPADWTVSTAHAALVQLDADAAAGVLPAAAAARARAVLWQGFARQQLGMLSGVLPDGLRKASSSLLTGFTAQDYYILADTLGFLADGDAAPQADVLPGTWNPVSGRYEFSDETLSFLQSFASSAASAPASSAASAP